MTKTSAPNFEPKWDLPATPLKSAYIVCTTPRTGSNLLCFALATQGIGRPLEYLNLIGNDGTADLYSRIMQRNLETDQQEDGLNPTLYSQYMSGIINRRTTANGYFGMKVFAHHFTHLFGDADLSILSSIIGCTPKIIHLVRQNLIEMTISFIVAKNTQRWHSEISSTESCQTVYNFNEFLKMMVLLRSIQNKWLDIFARNPNYEVLQITYKQLSEQYTETMTRVNDYLGVMDVEIPEQPIQKQLSQEKQKLIEQFTRDCKNNATQVRIALQQAKPIHT